LLLTQFHTLIILLLFNVMKRNLLSLVRANDIILQQYFLW
jgi:hypothetical protein